MLDFLFSFEQFIQDNSLLGLPASLAGGILVALSPCILPILPVTASIIGEAALATKLRSSHLSFIFVLGVTTTYVTLGVIAALFGIFMSKVISAFWVNLFLGVLFIVIGLTFFDFLHFSLFNINYTPKTTLFSIFALGLFTGLSMIPCAFPVLGTILSVISLKQNLIYGIGCLLFFSLGYGLVLEVAGSSTSFVRGLSKNKHWYMLLKRGLGVLIILMGIFFLSRLVIIG